MSRRRDKRPWLCRLGLHDFSELDSAMFNSVYICTRCDQPDDPVKGALLRYERRLWSSNPGMSPSRVNRLLARRARQIARQAKDK